jgi:tetraacyldisaccharide 4'-kinase
MHILEWLYYLGYQRKKKRLLAQQQHLDHPVISVGNITVGGTGKTPVTIALAAEACRRGYLPIILTRGYRGKAKGPCFVSIGKGPIRSVSDVGDEPFLMAGKLKGVPIVKASDRYKGGVFAVDHLLETVYAGLDQHHLLFILDDGFQHWKLARTVDIVLIDGLNPFGNRRLLPLGPLREPLHALKRADMIVLTKRSNETIAHELSLLNPAAPLYSAFYRTDALLYIDETVLPATDLIGKRIIAFSGIANPLAFRKTLETTGCHIQAFNVYPDHYRYHINDLRKLQEVAERHQCDLIVTTEKDLVKCSAYHGSIPLCALTVDIVFDKNFFDDLFSRLT